MNPNEFELARLRHNGLLREAEDGRLKNRLRAARRAVARRKRKESRLLSPPDSSAAEADLQETDLERCTKP